MTKTYIDAIKAIKPNADVGMEGTSYEGIIWFNETPIDKATLDAKLAELPTEEEERQARKNAQASGNQKLLDLGLTQAEATALTGYTPPVAE